MSTTFTFHSRGHVVAALAAAAETGASVILVTPPNGATSAGPEIFLEMVRAAREEVPQGLSRVVVDCGADAGTAMRALRCGWRDLLFTGSPATSRKIEEMTNALDGRFENDRRVTYDLQTANDPAWFCRRALSTEARA